MLIARNLSDNAPDEERALACLLNPVDGPDGRTPAHLFKARAPHPGRWAADRRPIVPITGYRNTECDGGPGAWACYTTITLSGFSVHTIENSPRQSLGSYSKHSRFHIISVYLVDLRK